MKGTEPATALASRALWASQAVIAAAVAAASGRRSLEGKTGAQRAPLQHTNRGRYEVALALLVMVAVAAAGLFGGPWPVTQAASSGTKCAGTLAAQNSAANAPMTAAQGVEILRELRAIRMLLQDGAASGARARRPAAPQPVRMRIEPGWHALGSARAPVTMVEFTDLQCPFCRRFQDTTFAEIKKDYIDTGKLRFIARSLPLPMHAYALGAAEAARCAGDQGKFWQFRDAVLDDQTPPTTDVLQSHASNLGLNLQQFQACVSGGKYKQVVEADRREATADGIHGTPAFVIGRVSGGWIEGVSMVGARPLPFFKQQIEAMLNQPPSASPEIHPTAGTSAARVAGFAGKQ